MPLNRWKIKKYKYYLYFFRVKPELKRTRKQFISVPGSIQVNNQRRVEDKKKITYNIFSIFISIFFYLVWKL